MASSTIDYLEQQTDTIFNFMLVGHDGIPSLPIFIGNFLLDMLNDYFGIFMLLGAIIAIFKFGNGMMQQGAQSWRGQLHHVLPTTIAIIIISGILSLKTPYKVKGDAFKDSNSYVIVELMTSFLGMGTVFADALTHKILYGKLENISSSESRWESGYFPSVLKASVDLYQNKMNEKSKIVENELGSYKETYDNIGSINENMKEALLQDLMNNSKTNGRMYIEPVLMVGNESGIEEDKKSKTNKDLDKTISTLSTIVHSKNQEIQEKIKKDINEKPLKDILMNSNIKNTLRDNRINVTALNDFLNNGFEEDVNVLNKIVDLDIKRLEKIKSTLESSINNNLKRLNDIQVSKNAENEKLKAYLKKGADNLANINLKSIEIQLDNLKKLKETLVYENLFNMKMENLPPQYQVGEKGKYTIEDVAKSTRLIVDQGIKLTAIKYNNVFKNTNTSSSLLYNVAMLVRKERVGTNEQRINEISEYEKAMEKYKQCYSKKKEDCEIEYKNYITKRLEIVKGKDDFANAYLDKDDIKYKTIIKDKKDYLRKNQPSMDIDYANMNNSNINLGKKINETYKEMFNEEQNKIISWVDLGKYYSVFKTMYAPMVSSSLYLYNLEELDQTEALAMKEFVDGLSKDKVAERTIALGTIVAAVSAGQSLANAKMKKDAKKATQEKNKKNIVKTVFEGIAKGGLATGGAAIESVRTLSSFYMLIYFVNVLFPAIIWMFMIITYYLEMSIYLAVFPIALLFMVFSSRGQALQKLLNVLVGMILLPIIFVSMYFVVLNIDMMIPAFIERLLPFFKDYKSISTSMSMSLGDADNIATQVLGNVANKISEYGITNSALENFGMMLYSVLTLILSMILVTTFLDAHQYLAKFVSIQYDMSDKMDTRQSLGKLKAAGGRGSMTALV